MWRSNNNPKKRRRLISTNPQTVAALFFRAPLIVICTVMMGGLSVLVSLVDKSGDAAHQVARWWAGLVLSISGATIRLSGGENLNRHVNCILVSNHQSYMDAPLVISRVNLQVRFFANKGLFGIPFLGTHLRRTGHLPVTSGDPRASLRSLHDAAALVRQSNVSVLLFPEGGRSRVGMLSFKEGAAYLAIKSGRPVVPLGIRGTRNLLPMGSISFRPGPIELHVGKPVVTQGLRPQDRASLTRLLEDEVARLCGDTHPRDCQPASALEST